MATIILRQSNVVTSTGGTVKGSPLTNAEVDNNFANLNVVINIHESNIGVLANLTTNNKDNVVNSIADAVFEPLVIVSSRVNVPDIEDN